MCPSQPLKTLSLLDPNQPYASRNCRRMGTSEIKKERRLGHEGGADTPGQEGEWWAERGSREEEMRAAVQAAWKRAVR